LKVLSYFEAALLRLSHFHRLFLSKTFGIRGMRPAPGKSLTTVKIGLASILRDNQWKVVFFEAAAAGSMAKWHASNIMNVHLLRMNTHELIENIESFAAYEKSKVNGRGHRETRPSEWIPDEKQLQSYLARVQRLVCTDSYTKSTGTHAWLNQMTHFLTRTRA
jgi:hypothetical protein